MSAGTRGVYRAAFASTAFRALFVAHTISVVGDQLARVALVVLVFDRTGSPAWAAVTYALTFLPSVLGGPLLAGLADRYPRRGVLITADLARAALIAAMALPVLPWQVVCVLLVAVQLAGAPAVPARTALLRHLLADSREFRAATAAMSTVTQAGQVVGFATGGVAVALLGPGGALLLDAGTFLASAALVFACVRPVVVDRSEARPGWWPTLRAGAGAVRRDGRLVVLIGLACLSGFYITGEALAAPYADALGGGPVAVGLLFAAYPLGCATASLVLAALPEATQLRAMPLLAISASAPLALCLLRPGLAATVVLFTVSGAASAYHVVAGPTFALLAPDRHLGQTYGLAITALQLAQGLGITTAGVAAEHAEPHQVVGTAGVLGVLAAVAVARLWHRQAHQPTART